MNNKRLNILHWPSAYPQPSKNKPYECIFVEEHIKSVIPFTNSKVLFVSADSCTSFFHEVTRITENNIETIRIAFNRKRNLQFLNLYIRIILLIEFIRLFVKGFKPDIIHVHFYQAGLWAILFCKLFKAKLVVTEHWSAFIGWPHISNKRFLEASKVFKYSTTILTVSQKMAEAINLKCNLNSKPQISVIPNVVDTAIFNHKQTTKKSTAINLLAVSRISEEKDIPNLLAALSQLDFEYTITIIGGGDTENMRLVTEKYGIEKNVIFLGAANKKTIAEYMQKADFFILSSFIENSPTVIGEALCCGCPVVATNVGGIPELINADNGILVAPRNSDDLANGIKLAIKKEFNRTKIAINAKSKFGMNAIGEKILKCYNEIHL